MCVQPMRRNKRLTFITHPLHSFKGHLRISQLGASIQAMGNVCVNVSDSQKPELGNYEDTSSSSSSSQSSRSSHGSLSFTKRLINLSGKRLTSMKKTRYAAPRTGSLDSPVWQRTILMGERCEPPDFSGLILYDEYGNSVRDFPCKPPKSPIHPALALVV